MDSSFLSNFNIPDRRLSCAVATCNNYYFKTKDLLYEGYPITYHYFPKSTELCNRWIEACNRDETFKADICFVCSIHFGHEDFTKQQIDPLSQQPKRNLKYNAVPSRNLTLDEITSFAQRKNWTNIFSDCQSDLEVINNRCDDANGSTSVDDSYNIMNDELITMTRNYEMLLDDYEGLKRTSKFEIQKLRTVLKEKETVFTTKLRKILAEHLSETEIDLVLFLKKQKKESTGS